MAPWPDQLCPYLCCRRPIRDLLAEMVCDVDQTKPDFKALLAQTPGGAITCPYCEEAVEYEIDGCWLRRSGNNPCRNHALPELDRRTQITAVAGIPRFGSGHRINPWHELAAIVSFDRS